MGRIGRYIDGLTDEQRDRIVAGQGWAPGDYIKPDGDRCLVGHVAGITLDDVLNWSSIMLRHTDAARARLLAAEGNTAPSARFDILCDRFGVERVVAALKARAGSLPPLSESVPSAGVRGQGAVEGVVSNG